MTSLEKEYQKDFTQCANCGNIFPKELITSAIENKEPICCEICGEDNEKEKHFFRKPKVC